MQKSNFNFVYTRDNGDIVIFNTYSKAIITLNETEYQAFQNDTYDEESKTIYIDNGILIEDNFDVFFEAVL